MRPTRNLSAAARAPQSYGQAHSERPHLLDRHRALDTVRSDLAHRAIRARNLDIRRHLAAHVAQGDNVVAFADRPRDAADDLAVELELGVVLRQLGAVEL